MGWKIGGEQQVKAREQKTATGYLSELCAYWDARQLLSRTCPGPGSAALRCPPSLEGQLSRAWMC